MEELSDPRHVRLLEWLTTAPSERVPATKSGLADELGVSARTLRHWQAQEGFVRVWERRVREVAGTPERTQLVLDTLFAAATDSSNRSQVQAAKLFLEAIDAIRPPEVQVSVRRVASELSDAELDLLLAEGAAQLRAERDRLSG